MALGAALLLLVSRPVIAQERGAIALGEAVAGLGVTARVLMVGAHPDDEDTFLIAWLSRGRHVATGYLSLTRGDGGQNLIGNELGEALGVIRTEELLAARRVDGGEQYFTRAFDFGFSKDTADTYKHWPRDSILGDVVRVVRSMRPHVIVAVFSGTPRDGHGHHQVSGLLAREAYDLAGDTVRFPVAQYGGAWTPLKFYRAARGNAQAGTLGMDVGEYSPLLGRSYAEIAGESRSQHKSQGFGALQRKGPLMNYVRREASRVNEATPAPSERTLFDGIDTSWARFRVADSGAQAALAALPGLITASQAAYDPFVPAKLVQPLARVRAALDAVCPYTPRNACWRVEMRGGRAAQVILDPDLASSIASAERRVNMALRLATGIALEANSIENWPLNTSVPVLTSLYNRGRDTVAVSGGLTSGAPPRPSPTRLLPPAAVLRDTLIAKVDSLSQPWWLAGGRTGAVFALPAMAGPENRATIYPGVQYTVDLGGRSMGDLVSFVEGVAFRFADDVKGEVERPVGGVPAIAVKLGQQMQYVPANSAIERTIDLTLLSATMEQREVRLMLSMPPGLAADSATRAVRLGTYGAKTSVSFRVSGRLGAGDHRIKAVAESGGESFTTGYDVIDYDHIRRQRIYRPAEIALSAVDVRVPATLRVAYVPGVSDNVAPTLAQLGINVTVVPARELAGADLARFTTVVIGPRAYEASPELVAANARILEFARTGGTVVVQYGQYEMTRPGIMPFPITINRPHDRVTHEDAPVTLVDAAARELTWPNRIGASDFDGWVQERSLYMPRTFDASYRALLAMNDPGEPANRGAILVARVGRGAYVYTSLAFFRQLPAGVPGAARLFVNLLSAGLPRAR